MRVTATRDLPDLRRGEVLDVDPNLEPWATRLRVGRVVAASSPLPAATPVSGRGTPDDDPDEQDGDLGAPTGTLDPDVVPSMTVDAVKAAVAAGEITGQAAADAEAAVQHGGGRPGILALADHTPEDDQ